MAQKQGAAIRAEWDKAAGGAATITREQVPALLRSLDQFKFILERHIDEALDELGAAGGEPITWEGFSTWWEEEGKLTASEKLDKKWGAFQSKFQRVLDGCLAAGLPALKAGLGKKVLPAPETPPLKSSDLAGIAEYIRSGRCKRVHVLTGAGVSVGAGIPDFRSAGGLYDTLRPELLTATPEQRTTMAENPTAVVSRGIFEETSLPYLEVRRPFILGLAQKQWKPTAAHFFLRLLHDKGLLSRVYTQNIDGLDYATGIPESKLLSCHGTMGRAECEFCKAPMPFEEFCTKVRTQIKDIYNTDKDAPKESTMIKCEACGRPGLKPATVLYGSDLPQSFADGLDEDFFQTRRIGPVSGTEDHPDEAQEEEGSLLIVSGTSLTVSPANSVVPRSGPTNPKLVVNREAVGDEFGLDFGNGRDVFAEGDADDGFIALAAELGWLEELAAYAPQMAEASAALIRAKVAEAA